MRFKPSEFAEHRALMKSRNVAISFRHILQERPCQQQPGHPDCATTPSLRRHSQVPRHRSVGSEGKTVAQSRGTPSSMSVSHTRTHAFSLSLSIYIARSLSLSISFYLCLRQSRSNTCMAGSAARVTTPAAKLSRSATASPAPPTPRTCTQA